MRKTISFSTMLVLTGLTLWAVTRTGGQHHGGAFAVAATAWLDWQLKDDEKASLMFIGDDCGFCKKPPLENRS